MSGSRQLREIAATSAPGNDLAPTTTEAQRQQQQQQQQQQQKQKQQQQQQEEQSKSLFSGAETNEVSDPKRFQEISKHILDAL